MICSRASDGFRLPWTRPFHPSVQAPIRPSVHLSIHQSILQLSLSAHPGPLTKLRRDVHPPRPPAHTQGRIAGRDLVTLWRRHSNSAGGRAGSGGRTRDNPPRLHGLRRAKARPAFPEKGMWRGGAGGGREWGWDLHMRPSPSPSVLPGAWNQMQCPQGPEWVLFSTKTGHRRPLSVAMETRDDVTWTSCFSESWGLRLAPKGPQGWSPLLGGASSGSGGDRGPRPPSRRGHQPARDVQGEVPCAAPRRSLLLTTGWVCGPLGLPPRRPPASYPWWRTSPAAARLPPKPWALAAARRSPVAPSLGGRFRALSLFSPDLCMFLMAPCPSLHRSARGLQAGVKNDRLPPHLGQVQKCPCVLPRLSSGQGPTHLRKSPLA